MTLTTLPLINFARGLFPQISLKNCLLIGVQHILPTTYQMCIQLLEAGLLPQNLFILGKCYSTNPKVFHLMKDLQIHVQEESTYFDSHESYDITYERIIDAFVTHALKQCTNSSYEKVLILDDGGHLLEKIYHTSIDKTHFVGIEQTSAGYHRTASLSFSFPVINLARAPAKLRLETPLIIRSSLMKAEQWLNSIFSEEDRLLIMGGGFLGKHAAQYLQKRYQVFIYDRQKEKSDLSYETFLKELPSFRGILGCTGSTSLPFSMHSYLRKATLISLSSSDREFDAVTLRKHEPAHGNCHAQVHTPYATLANCGFPINFDENYDTVDPEEFQFTRALIFLAIAQAYTQKNLPNGYCHLDKEKQELIAENFTTIYEKTT